MEEGISPNIITYSILVEATGFAPDSSEKAVLINNGRDLLEISSNGQYPFEKQIKAGDDYEVVLHSKPMLKNCTLENKSGTVADLSPIINLICEDKGWHGPIDITDKISPSGYNAHNPSVDMDGQGNAIIVWEQDDGGAYRRIYKSEYRNGQWSHPRGNYDSINRAGSGAYYPRVSMSDSGDAVIAWAQERYGEGASEVFMSEYRNGGWVHPTSLSSYISPAGGGTLPDSIKLDMDRFGNTLIVYNDMDMNGRNQVYKSEYRNGVWTHPFDRSDDISKAAVFAVFPGVSMGDSGNAVIVWGESNGSPDTRIVMNERGTEGWSGGNMLINHPGGVSYFPSVAVNDSGEVIISWYQGGDHNHIYKSEKIAGAWFHPQNIGDYISHDCGVLLSPQAAISNTGDMLISWNQSTPARWGLYKSEKRKGTWKNPLNEYDFIDPGFTSVNNDFSLAMDNFGNSIIVWLQNDGSIYNVTGVYISQYRKETWDHPGNLTDRISPRDTGAQGRPSVAMSDNGDAIVVWTQSDGANSQIYMSHYR